MKKLILLFVVTAAAVIGVSNVCAEGIRVSEDFDPNPSFAKQALERARGSRQIPKEKRNCGAACNDIGRVAVNPRDIPSCKRTVIGTECFCNCVEPSRKVPAVSKDFSVMTFNTYCFPDVTTKALKFVKDTDLQSGIKKSVTQRINEIAAFVKIKSPDVVCFQELWGNDNKEQMIKMLRPDYIDYHYISRSIPVYRAIMLDDGLLILSKHPLSFKSSITYKDSASDEKMAQKGALFVGLKDGANQPVLVATTHLQSGGALEYVRIRDKQMHEMGRKLKEIITTEPTLKESRIVVTGDFNEAIHYSGARKLLVNYTAFLVKALNDEGIDLSNDQVARIIGGKLGAQEIATVNELLEQGVVKSLVDASEKAMDISDPFIKSANQWHTFDATPFGSSASGDQVIDHIFIEDKKSRVTKFEVFRAETLGAVGPLKGSDLPDNAISDHAAVMVTFERSL